MFSISSVASESAKCARRIYNARLVFPRRCRVTDYFADDDGPVTPIYTDGSSIGTVASSAWLIPYRKWEIFVNVDDTRSLTAELWAIESAIKNTDGNIHIHTDCLRAVDILTSDYNQWRRYIWNNPDVPYAEEYTRIMDLIECSSRNIYFTWVKSHSRVKHHNFVDRLCYQAIEDYKKKHNVENDEHHRPSKNNRLSRGKYGRNKKPSGKKYNK